MGIVIGAVAVVFVLALIIFPGVRGKLKVLVGGFLNIFVEDIAKAITTTRTTSQTTSPSVRALSLAARPRSPQQSPPPARRTPLIP